MPLPQVWHTLYYIIMRTSFKLLACALGIILGSHYSFSQETKDYYKFNDKGIVSEFQQTTPDGVRITYNEENHLGLIFYPDGTQVDFSASLTQSFDGARIWPNRKLYDTYGALPMNDWYKENIRKAGSAPVGAEMMDNIFGIKQLTIVFPDNSQVTIEYEEYGARVNEYTDISEEGDRLCINRSSEIKILNLKNPAVVDPETGALTKHAKFASGVNIDKWYGNILNGYESAFCKGNVITDDGSTFTGKYGVLLSGEKRNYAPKSQYLVALFGDRSKKSDDYTCPPYGINNIAGIFLINGTVVNKDNKIVAMYQDAKMLDEFDMASVLAVEQGKLDNARAAAKKAASEKASITSKYGSKYADAFFAGKVIVGMPWKLVQIGLDAHSFKSFYTALLSIERQSSSGNRQLYSLIGDDLSTVGHIWVKNGSVESVTYY